MTGTHYEVILANGTVLSVPRVAETQDSGSLMLLRNPSDGSMFNPAIATLAPGVWLAYRRVED